MESGRRAVESYWRFRMIDYATSDEDQVTPVYKLEEICDLLRSSPAGIVKEVSEFVLRRLAHKSPIVKQKTLRLIKYSVGKSGAEFRREMQRHSVAVKQLLHYKGQPDPLKGDALNKAVRETAQDALSAIFSTDDNKPASSEVSHKRMEGFGNTNFVQPSGEKNSFLSEVADIGSASIKQGLSNLAQAQSLKRNDTGSYRGPALQRLTKGPDYSDMYEKMEYHCSNQGNSGMSGNVTSGTWGQGSILGHMEATSGDSSSPYIESKTWEERFLETIVTSGGVRLQPPRDALQNFLTEASKMDALALSRALESKLQSPHWQVRMRAVCVLEAILRKNDDEQFAIVTSYFGDNVDIVIRCSESPQASLREKANRVLTLLGGRQMGNASEKPARDVRKVVEMPDLIDTGEHDLLGAEGPKETQNDQHVVNKSSPASPLIDDLFGDGIDIGLSSSKQRTYDDLFADVSFHSVEDKNQGSDLFAGMTVGGNPDTTCDVPTTGGPDPFDIFRSSEPVQKQEERVNDLKNLMSNLSISVNGSMMNLKENSTRVLSDSLPFNSDSKLGSQVLNNSLSGGGLDTLNTSGNVNAMFPMGANLYSMPPGVLVNQFYPSEPVDYGSMSGFLTQQQFMAAMANFHSLGSLNSQSMPSSFATETLGGNSSTLPDIFNTNMPTQSSTVTFNTSNKETKAFDFISDHLAAARDPKRMI